MSAYFSATCACGRTATAPCPTLDGPDRAAATAEIEAAGFVWHPGLGYRCPEWPVCSPVPPPSPPPQASLFPDEAP